MSEPRHPDTLPDVVDLDDPATNDLQVDQSTTPDFDEEDD